MACGEVDVETWRTPVIEGKRLPNIAIGRPSVNREAGAIERVRQPAFSATIPAVGPSIPYFS
jgi:hypothetical protein